MDTTRDPAVDFYRSLALVAVVLGHWLLTVTYWSGGRLQADNLLDLAPWTQWVTWVVQPIPLFFVVGGWSGARSWRRSRGYTTATAWLSQRLTRLLVPVCTFTVAALVLAAILAVAVPASAGKAAGLLGMPLWFLAVYIPITAATPALVSAVDHSGWRIPRGLLIAAVGVDLVRFHGHFLGIGWVNFGFVWLMFAAIGVAVEAASPRRPHVAVVGVAALTALVGVVAAGWYPVSMVGVGARSNNTPPTVALALLGLVQACIAGLAAPAVRRMLARHQTVRTASQTVGAFGMHLYLWHLCATLAMVTLQLVGVMNLEPLHGTWWLTRPLWLLMLATLVAPVVIGAARFDLGRSARPRVEPVNRRSTVWVSAFLAVVALTVISLHGFGLGPVALLSVGGIQIAAVLVQRRYIATGDDGSGRTSEGKSPWVRDHSSSKVDS